MQLSPTRNRRRHSYTDLNITSDQDSNSNSRDTVAVRRFWLFGLFRRPNGRRCPRAWNKKLVALAVTILCLLLLLACVLYNYLTAAEMGRPTARRGAEIDSVIDDDDLAETTAASKAVFQRVQEIEDPDAEFVAYFDPQENELNGQRRLVDELARMKISLNNEIKNLEQKRNNLRTELEALRIQAERSQGELRRTIKELEQIRSSLAQTKLMLKEASERNTPDIALPRPLFPSTDAGKTSVNDGRSTYSSAECTMSQCFDYSRCSITSGFPIYVYDKSEFADVNPDLSALFSQSGYAVSDGSKACLYILAVKNNIHLNKDILSELIYWRRTFDGANHVIFNAEAAADVGRAIAVFNTVPDQHFRLGYDLFAPLNASIDEEQGDKQSILFDAPALLPTRRKYFLSVFWCPSSSEKADDQQQFLIEHLRKIQTSQNSDAFYFDKCDVANQEKSDTSAILRLSTFTLLIADRRNTKFADHFVRSLQYGAVPVVLLEETDSRWLPFAETLNWKRACIPLAGARISELHFYLRTFVEADILHLRQNGRLFYNTYFASKRRVVDTVLAVLRQRLNIPAAPAQESVLPSLFNDTFKPRFGDITKNLLEQSSLNEVDEYLGPVELPYPSASFQQNFSQLSLYSYELWNVHAEPFRFYPQIPFVKLPLPPEAKFLGSPYGYRPINNGAGGSGREFSEALGGNFPREQFTVVLLTYEREQVLLAALGRLNNLPYLNKIVVVWNGATPPNMELLWPKLSVPVVVVKPERNSLNNRFLPFREIETEAILSIDDDVHLRHDEIIFGFRVWREARDNIVGFPGRFHAWDTADKAWRYNSNHSCELSMVLTGAAFLHKYYMYVYSYSMPSIIRQKVDEIMNCEDIAMNFLVAHMTKKPPLKVTSRWTFRCPGCPETLSADESHFLERHDCINYFIRAYGYNPLQYTQYRVDSILFKTKIPHTHQKCFKFI